MLWLHRSPGLPVLLLRLWVSAPWLAGVPHLTLPHAIRAHCAALPLLASAICCCLGLSCSFLSVFHSLKGSRLTILCQNQHFGLFIPLGEKIFFLLQLEQSAALRLGRRQSGAGGAEDHWSLLAFADTAHQLGPPECDCFPQERIKAPAQA